MHSYRVLANNVIRRYHIYLPSQSSDICLSFGMSHLMKVIGDRRQHVLEDSIDSMAVRSGRTHKYTLLDRARQQSANECRCGCEIVIAVKVR